MNEHIVHLTGADAETQKPAGWENALEKEGFHLLRAKTLNQAKYYAKAYRLVGLLIDLNGDDAATSEAIQDLLKTDGACRFPIFGLSAKTLRPKSQRQLAEAGMTSLINSNAPPEFLMHQLRAQRELLSVKLLEENGMDLNSLSQEARKILHDLSQPLAALQGRLQILEIKSLEGDPLKGALKDMTGLAMQVTDHLRQLHELHRKYS